MRSSKRMMRLKVSLRLQKFAIGLLPILIMLGGCAKNLPVIDTFCLKYQPVYTSIGDTEETKRQVDENNAVWMEGCQCFMSSNALGCLQ